MPVDDRAFRLAVNLARRGEMQAARNLLRDIIERKEDDEQTWLWLAATYKSDDTRLRILQVAYRRYPEGALVQKALDTTQRRVEQKKIPGIENGEVAPQLEISVVPPTEQTIEAGAVSAVSETAADRGSGSTDAESPVKSSDWWKLLLGVAVVLFTILTAYLWTQLR